MAPIQPVSKPRIDPDQIPSPVAVQSADQEEWDLKPFVTSSRTNATPLASSDFMGIDGGKELYVCPVSTDDYSYILSALAHFLFI
jgi:hypothetical protein